MPFEIRRVGGEEDHVRPLRLDGADGRREVHRARRVGPVIDHPQPVFLAQQADTFRGALGEVVVDGEDRDRLRRRRQHLGAFEEAAGIGALDVVSGDVHREVAVVLQLLVHAGAEQRNVAHAPLHHDGHGWRDHRGGVGRGDDIDLVDIDQLRIERGDVGRVALVVIGHQLHRAAEDAALGIHVLRPDLLRQQRRAAIRREAARRATSRSRCGSGWRLAQRRGKGRQQRSARRQPPRGQGRVG